MLAGLRRRRLPELRADFREFYGVSADEIGRGLPAGEAADLAAQLPARSRCAAPEGQAPGWDDAVWLLARIEHALRVGLWRSSAAAEKGEGFPEMASPRVARPPAVDDGSMTVEQLEERLSRKRG